MNDKRRRSPYQNENFIQALKHAKDGFIYALVHERNMKFHALAALAVFVLSAVLAISWLEFLWVVLAVSLMFITELMNTAIEILVDLMVGESYHPLAKIAKDLGAAIALLAAIFSLAVAAVVFLPKIL